MRLHRLHQNPVSCLAVLGLCLGPAAWAQAASAARGCANDDTGLTLSPGFCASVFADHLGHVRHIVVAPNGVVYANVWSGRYYAGAPVPPRFPAGPAGHDRKPPRGQDHPLRRDRAQGDHGGTGIGYYKTMIYAEANDRIVRYRLAPGEVVPPGRPRRWCRASRSTATTTCTRS